MPLRNALRIVFTTVAVAGATFATSARGAELDAASPRTSTKALIQEQSPAEWHEDFVRDGEPEWFEDCTHDAYGDSSYTPTDYTPKDYTPKDITP